MLYWLGNPKWKDNLINYRVQLAKDLAIYVDEILLLLKESLPDEDEDVFSNVEEHVSKTSKMTKLIDVICELNEDQMYVKFCNAVKKVNGTLSNNFKELLGL